ncbi:lipoprotein [Spiroplasma endosymbiont of Dioctria linearis]|uniref:lipoprotein n=1 Tax=Spiroplasma endosymbiont of Dioctria linearis TaxID=3066290 RepID=UPI00313F33D4
MKKLLTLFTAITLFASTSTSVISCQSEKKFELPNQPKSGDDIVEALDNYFRTRKNERNLSKGTWWM